MESVAGALASKTNKGACGCEAGDCHLVFGPRGLALANLRLPWPGHCHHISCIGPSQSSPPNRPLPATTVWCVLERAESLYGLLAGLCLQRPGVRPSSAVAACQQPPSPMRTPSWLRQAIAA